MNRIRSLHRAAAAALAAAILGSCADAPVAARTSGVQLLISLGSQAAASRRVDVVVGYETSTGDVTHLSSSLNMTVATGTQQLPVSVDLTRCLSDANHAGGTGVCRLRVAVTLKDGTTGEILDVAHLGPIDASPGSSPAPATITVAAVDLITIGGLSSSYVVGSTAQATATVKDAAGNTLSRPVAWTSTNPAVATVTPTGGLVTIVGPGTTQIGASAGGVTATVTVTAIPAVSTVTVSPPSASIFVGETVQLAATAHDAGGNGLPDRAVTWSSSSGTATVNSSGLVTGVSAGSATITATSEGQSGSATITVSVPPPANLSSVSPASMSGTHFVEETSCPQLLGAATIQNVSSGNITWSASESHAAIDLLGTTSGTLAPGASANFSVRFNCSQAVSFSTTITFNVQQGAVSEVKTVSVTVTVNP